MALIPEDISQFRSKTFWDGFFQERGGKAFEWYGDWQQLSPLLRQYCAREEEVLIVGCGNSMLGEHMRDDGYGRLISVDYSEEAWPRLIQTRQHQHQHHPPINSTPSEVKTGVPHGTGDRTATRLRAVSGDRRSVTPRGRVRLWVSLYCCNAGHPGDAPQARRRARGYGVRVAALVPAGEASPCTERRSTLRRCRT